MKRLAFLLLLLPRIATAQPPDVAITRASDGTEITYRSKDRSPEAVYRLLENVCEQQAEQGDQCTFRGIAISGPYDMLDLSKLSKFAGVGVADSRIVMLSQHDRQAAANGNEIKPGGPSLMPPGTGPHTPGPWTTDVTWVKPSFNHHVVYVHRDAQVIAQCWLTDTFDGSMESRKAETEANARLIAAAPDLLVACKAASSALADRYGQSPAMMAVQSAISKATGQSVAV